MGFLEDGVVNWLPLRRSSSKEKVLSSSRAGYEQDQSQDMGRDFDIADSMERGLAREIVADFMEPLPDATGLWKFVVERSDNRQEYRLYCDSGEFLMYAKLARDARRVDIHLYDPREKDSALYDADRPAFSIACNAAKTEWKLKQDRCDSCRHTGTWTTPCAQCRGCSELLRVKHSNLEVGDGINHCMDVSVPEDGREKRFVTKMPVWNDKVECLVLDFKGRKILASAKNFQLAAEDDEGERVVCQYGKLSHNRFGLDFRYPLTVAQAFGISLSTLFWA
mmetsp:Transcript_36201/g.109441  ORF Transcript_36201/g.109441 Transcript_36201/m.109441 type:complete len:279 (-) Transcript_36201:46-882(-)